MTIQEWLKKYDVSVEFYIRGFRFESPYGAVHQQVRSSERMPQSHVNFTSVLKWLKGNPQYVSKEAMKELRQILKITNN